jgi:hypothetical protein
LIELDNVGAPEGNGTAKLMIALFVTAGLGLAGASAAQMNSPMTAPISKASYTQAVKDADAQYKIDKDACSSLSGNAMIEWQVLLTLAADTKVDERGRTVPALSVARIKSFYDGTLLYKLAKENARD